MGKICHANTNQKHYINFIQSRLHNKYYHEPRGALCNNKGSIL